MGGEVKLNSATPPPTHLQAQRSVISLILSSLPSQPYRSQTAHRCYPGAHLQPVSKVALPLGSPGVGATGSPDLLALGRPTTCEEEAQRGDLPAGGRGRLGGKGESAGARLSWRPGGSLS